MNNYRDIRVIDDQVTRALLTKIALFFERIKYYDLSESMLSRMHDDINIALEDLKKEIYIITKILTWHDLEYV